MNNPWKSLVQTSNIVNAGTMDRIPNLLSVNQRNRWVYCNAKASHATGKMTMLTYWSLAQRSLPARTVLPSSRAYSRDQVATVSISNVNGLAPGVSLRRQPILASTAVTAVGMTKDNTYGLYCQCIERSFTPVWALKQLKIENQRIKSSKNPACTLNFFWYKKLLFLLDNQIS